jgi:small subunit ribosomal protein S3
MGQKINPTGFRLAVSRNWGSRWYASGKEFSRMLGEDLRVREYLKKRLRSASVGRILIERPAKNARITIYSARPGVVIGKKGEDIESLKSHLQKMLGVPVHVNIDEIRKPELDAQLIADSITQQLEKRIMFRRAMKRAMQNAMRLGAQGIKIMSAGRLNGIEIARTEWYREGRVPLHTLRANIDYGFSEAKTTYGVIGVKVWVYKGDTLGRNEAPAASEPAAPAPEREDRRPPRGRPGGGKPGGGTGRRPPRKADEPRTEAAAEPAREAAPAPATPAVKRVRKAATPGKPDAAKPDAKPADKGGAKNGD